MPQFEEQALSERAVLQEDVAKYRDKIYANIAAFKAKAVAWFKTRADRNRFKSSLTRMRGGFVQIFSADESLMKALYALGTNADVAGANNEIMAAGMTEDHCRGPVREGPGPTPRAGVVRGDGRRQRARRGRSGTSGVKSLK